MQSTYPKIKEMVGGLVRLLDGRSDVKSVDFERSSAFDEPDIVSFDPLRKRFDLSTNSPAVTSVKTNILDLLITLTDFRTQFRLAK
jgi:hypothetical protein